MKELSTMSDAAVVAAYDFSSVKRLVDIGGGQGSLLATILKQYPSIQGTLNKQLKSYKIVIKLWQAKENY